MKNTILNKWLIMLSCVLIIGCSIKIVEASAITRNTLSEAYIPSEMSSVIDLTTTVEYKQIRNISKTEDTQELRTLIQECKTLKESAEQMLVLANNLGYTDKHPVVKTTAAEIEQLNKLITIYENRLEQKRWETRIKKYPAASSIWLYLSDQGYSDEICAGILGNIMAEVGGHTLDIEHTTNTHPEYYGICQWSLKYSNTKGMNLSEQCQYLVETIENEFNSFGSEYKSGFNYNDFIEMTDIEEIALAFAKCYERCGSGSYDVRQSNALIAFEYFTS